MFAILSLLTILALSILVTRVAAISLVHTGMAREAARFRGVGARREPRDTRIVAGDGLILYGRTTEFERVDRRRKGRRGDRDHIRAVREQQQIEAQERAIRTLEGEPSGKS